MSLELSSDLRQAIDQAGTPLRIVDSKSGDAFVVVPESTYAAIQALLGENLAETYPAQIESAAKKQSQPVSAGPSAAAPSDKAVAATSPAKVIRRLPAVESPEPPQVAERLTPRDIFRRLPPVEETKLR